MKHVPLIRADEMTKTLKKIVPRQNVLSAVTVDGWEMSQALVLYKCAPLLISMHPINIFENHSPTLQDPLLVDQKQANLVVETFEVVLSCSTTTWVRSQPRERRVLPFILLDPFITFKV